MTFLSIIVIMDEYYITLTSMLIGVVSLAYIYLHFIQYKKQFSTKEIEFQKYSDTEKIEYMLELIKANVIIVNLAIRLVSFLFIITFLLSRFLEYPMLLSKIGAVIVLIGLIFELELISIENKKSKLSYNKQLELSNTNLDNKYYIHGIIVFGTLLSVYGDVFVSIRLTFL